MRLFQFIKMINTPFLLLLFVVVARAEERLSWFTTDPEIRRSIFVPDNLAEGKEENRILPWVFHSDDETKLMQIKCIMRGYNASNNPSDYQEARWSHPGFDDGQVNTSAPPVKGDEDGVPYAIWTMEISISAEDAGKKWATCEWQQGDFPLSTDFTFLIFNNTNTNTTCTTTEAETIILSFGLGEQQLELDEKDINQQIEDDIKRQISEHYSMSASSVSRSEDGQEFLITVNQTQCDASAQDGLTTGGKVVIGLLVMALLACLVIFVMLKQWRGESILIDQIGASL